MEKVGAASFGTQQEAYSYLEKLPEGFNGRAYCAESGKWMVSWRFVPNYSITSELDADEWDAEFRAESKKEAHCIGTFWTEKEIAIINELAQKQELSHIAVLRQSLRNYQLIATGAAELTINGEFLGQLNKP
jgi:hypothetical protein